jgi:hypothetical protein
VALLPPPSFHARHRLDAQVAIVVGGVSGNRRLGGVDVMPSSPFKLAVLRRAAWWSRQRRRDTVVNGATPELAQSQQSR